MVNNKMISPYNFLLSSVIRCCGESVRNNYTSQFTVETYCFADGRCLIKKPRSVIIYNWAQHNEISKCVNPSVRV